MARIAGVDLPRSKRVEVGLTYIFGIGPTRSVEILGTAGVSPDTRVKDLTEEEVRQIGRAIEEFGRGRGRPAEGDLAEHQAPDRDRMLSRSAPQAESAGARPAHEHERPDPGRARAAERSPRRKRADGRSPAASQHRIRDYGQERQRIGKATGGPAEAPQEDVQEARREAGRPSRGGAHPGVVQQHHHHRHRQRRRRAVVVERRRHRLQGVSEGNALRGRPRRRWRRAPRPRRTACARSRSG